MSPDHHHNPIDRLTPPFSPRAPVQSQSTLQLVDSLVSFYRQEMMWVYRMRASLELVDPPPVGTSDENLAVPSETNPSPSTFMTVKEEDELVVIKTETPMVPTMPQSRWQRRKHKFKLKLDGLPPAALQRRASAYGVSDSGMRVLELFEGMMEARMESCQRVNRMVRMANRANLYVR